MQVVNDLFQNKFSEIISEALSLDKLDGIKTILEMLSDAVGACGCILWESEPFSKFQNNPPVGSLYLFAKWFSVEDLDRTQNPKKIPLYKIPIDGSANGYALVNHEKENEWMVKGIMSIRDARDSDAPTHKENYLIRKLNVTSMCVVPICFDCKEGTKNASLAIYRNEKVKEFTAEEQKFIKTVAELIPQLYEAICDKVGKNLLEKANKILDKIDIGDRKEDGKRPSAEEQKQKIIPSLKAFCGVIADAFQCVETSLFFNDSEGIEVKKTKEKTRKIESVFKLYATNYEDWTKEKIEYFPHKEEGLTGWVLAERKPVTVFNLLTFHEDKENGSYEKDLYWNDSLNFNSDDFKEKLRAMLGLDKLPQNEDYENDQDIPPLSFMAVPILRGDKLLGVIRCCAAKNNPWIFPERHSRILTRIAILISRFWNDFILHLEEIEEAKSWENLIEKINKLNKKVQGKIDRLDFNEDEVYDEILKITQQTFDEIDILDIRRMDKEKEELYFARTFGAAWEQLGSKIERDNRKNKRFSKKDIKKTLAFEVIETGNVKFIPDVEKEAGYDPVTFPQTRQIIIAPIGIADTNIGVLDIRRTTDNLFPSNAPIMAELIGRQLGLYLELWETEKQQRRVFEDTWHQLKSPIRFNFARAAALLDHECFNEEPYIIDEDTAKEIVNELFMFRGVARKAKKVLDNAGIFTELATKGQLKPIKGGTTLTFRDFRKMISEIVTDTKLLLEDYRNIRFHRGLETFEKLDRITVRVNTDYLEQALNCLLDNAGKYSYTDTWVKIYGGEEFLENKRYFYIAVENQGLEISDVEKETLKKRKTRGEWAKLTTGEGSGIGLWITDHIMKAHGGKLIITPTTLRGINVVKLLLPISN